MNDDEVFGYIGYEHPQATIQDNILQYSWQPGSYEELAAFIARNFPYVDLTCCSVALCEDLVELHLRRLSEGFLRVNKLKPNIA